VNIIINLLLNNKKENMAEHLTKTSFLEKVFNYEQNKEWKYTGDKPCIIDFYADWCAPCKMVAPVLEELAKEYEGKLYVYKVDTEAEQELASIFGIRSIPSLLFVPMDGQPQMAMGALPKDVFEKAFKDIFGVEKN
jgi:thioredoxin 1